VGRVEKTQNSNLFFLWLVLFLMIGFEVMTFLPEKVVGESIPNWYPDRCDIR
jgi:hypothetical protein